MDWEERPGLEDKFVKEKLYRLKASLFKMFQKTKQNNKQMKQMQTLVSYPTSLFYWIIPHLNTIAPSEAINTRLILFLTLNRVTLIEAFKRN